MKKNLTSPLLKISYVSHILHPKNILQKSIFYIIICKKQHKTTRIRQLQSNLALNVTYKSDNKKFLSYGLNDVLCTNQY